jgi:5-(carboxyamino)imidazole ribonucleotide synthase
MILPGQTVGIVGGGQLGRMFTLAARRLGYRVHVLDPTRDCPTGQVADREVNAPYDDRAAAVRFANAVDVVTFEFENVPAETLAAIERLRPVHPAPSVLHTTRHRRREKDFLRHAGIPVADYRPVCSLEELRHAVEELGTPCILKTAELGYDGKGQVRIDSTKQLAGAWRAVRGVECVLEALVPFDREISVIVARSAKGQVVCYEPFENEHRNHILDVTRCPAGIGQTLREEARELATRIARGIKLVGVLCAEMFVVGNRLLVNELAPRPHNSGHLTIDACVTSQFEQQLRAVCGLPLGDPSLVRPAAMANLLGDLWQDGEPRWQRVLAMSGVQLHLYGKSEPRPGRKMGHLTACADTADEARSIVLTARRALK